MTELQQLPKELRPSSTQDEVLLDVDFLATKKLSSSHLDHLHKTLGLNSINSEFTSAIRQLGIAAFELGILQTMRGTILVAQEGMVTVMAKTLEIINDPEANATMRLEASRIYGYLVGQLSKLNVGSGKVEQPVVKEHQVKEQKNMRASFEIGEPIDV